MDCTLEVGAGTLLQIRISTLAHAARGRMSWNPHAACFSAARSLDAEHAADVLKGEYLERDSCMGWPAILDWTG
jgi:hypothetical protein